MIERKMDGNKIGVEEARKDQEEVEKMGEE